MALRGLWIVTGLVGCAFFLADLNSKADEPEVKATLPRFELRAGDRIVLLGSRLIEQERRHGYLETRLSRRIALERLKQPRAFAIRQPVFLKMRRRTEEERLVGDAYKTRRQLLDGVV